LRKAITTLSLVLANLILMIAGTLFVGGAIANPLPAVDPEIRIDSVQNATFTADSISVNFTGEANWNIYAYYYSFDNQSLRPIENVTIVSNEQVNPGRNPGVYRTTVQGSCILCNLSEGWHNVTIYSIATQDFVWNFPQYQKGETMGQAEYSFKILGAPQLTFPITLAGVASAVLITFAVVAIVSAGLLIYWKKHKDRKTKLGE
jgi:hypothetical protein